MTDSLTCHKYDIWESLSSDCWEMCSEKKNNLISDYHKYNNTFGVGIQDQVWKGWYRGIDKKEVAIGQTYMRKETGNIMKEAMFWTPDEKKKGGRPKKPGYSL